MTRDKLILVGISCRTTNAAEGSQEAKIPGMFGRYFSEEIFSKIPNPASPGTLYSCYANYASDKNGEYTYFLGEQVTSVDALPLGFDVLEVPSQAYHIFSASGPMPQTCINAWQSIWSDAELNSRRNYLVDFEKYDMCKMTPDVTEFEIFIGVK